MRDLTEAPHRATGGITCYDTQRCCAPRHYELTNLRSDSSLVTNVKMQETWFAELTVVENRTRNLPSQLEEEFCGFMYSK